MTMAHPQRSPLLLMEPERWRQRRAATCSFLQLTWLGSTEGTEDAHGPSVGIHEVPSKERGSGRGCSAGDCFCTESPSYRGGGRARTTWPLGAAQPGVLRVIPRRLDWGLGKCPWSRQACLAGAGFSWR